MTTCCSVSCLHDAWAAACLRNQHNSNVGRQASTLCEATEKQADSRKKQRQRERERLRVSEASITVNTVLGTQLEEENLQFTGRPHEYRHRKCQCRKHFARWQSFSTCVPFIVSIILTSLFSTVLIVLEAVYTV